MAKSLKLLSQTITNIMIMRVFHGIWFTRRLYRFYIKPPSFTLSNQQASPEEVFVSQNPGSFQHGTPAGVQTRVQASRRLEPSTQVLDDELRVAHVLPVNGDPRALLLGPEGSVSVHLAG